MSNSTLHVLSLYWFSDVLHCFAVSTDNIDMFTFVGDKLLQSISLKKQSSTGRMAPQRMPSPASPNPCESSTSIACIAAPQRSTWPKTFEIFCEHPWTNTLAMNGSWNAWTWWTGTNGWVTCGKKFVMNQMIDVASSLFTQSLASTPGSDGPVSDALPHLKHVESHEFSNRGGHQMAKPLRNVEVCIVKDLPFV